MLLNWANTEQDWKIPKQLFFSLSFCDTYFKQKRNKMFCVWLIPIFWNFLAGIVVLRHLWKRQMIPSKLCVVRWRRVPQTKSFKKSTHCRWFFFLSQVLSNQGYHLSMSLSVFSFNHWTCLQVLLAEKSWASKTAGQIRLGINSMVALGSNKLRPRCLSASVASCQNLI